MRTYAILIDGGFIRRRLGTREKPLDAAGIEAFVDRLRVDPQLSDLSLYRIYYYDATPLTSSVDKPLKGGTINFGQSSLAQFSQQLYSHLARLPYFSLRLGVTAFRGWKMSPKKIRTDVPRHEISAADLQPDVHQKGVDMRIGMDVAALTLKKHVQVIVLVAGDSDFVPAMKFARREGVQLLLAPLGHSIRPEVVEHSDVVLATK